MNKLDHEKLDIYRKELLEIERRATQNIEGYQLTPTAHMNWLTYHAEMWDLRVIVVFGINYSFDGFALIGKDNNRRQVVSIEIMKGTVPDLIQCIVDMFNESHPLAA